MALESATYVSGLVATNPTGSDSISQGDDHLRLIKPVLKNTFPNADEAINGVHTSGSAPSPTTAGLIWFDTSTNLIKIRNEANDGWINIIASEGSRLLKVTHAIQSASSTIRSASYTDTGFTITHSKLSATSTLYVDVQFMQNCFSSFSADSEIKVFMQLTNDSGTIITGTTADVQVFDLNDKVPTGLSTVEASTVPARTFKVTAANAPGGSGSTGNQIFNVYGKLENSDQVSDGGFSVINGIMMVREIEE